MVSGELQAHVRISLLRIVQGFLLAAGLAIPAGILAAGFPPFAQYLSPMLGFLRQVPPVAWIPVLIMVLGIGEATKLAVIVYAAFFPIFINTVLGITQIDNHFWEVARLLEFSPREALRELILPASAPSLIAGFAAGDVQQLAGPSGSGNAGSLQRIGIYDHGCQVPCTDGRDVYRDCRHWPFRLSH